MQRLRLTRQLVQKIGQSNVLSSYVDYYHRARTHLSLDKDCPHTRPIQPPRSGEIIAMPQVGGLHHRYQRFAA